MDASSSWEAGIVSVAMAANASLVNSEGRKVNLENATVAELITDLLAQQRIPGATYRLQFHAGFTLGQAETLVSYFNELGITDCYASPLFKARTGSSHATTSVIIAN